MFFAIFLLLSPTHGLSSFLLIIKLLVMASEQLGGSECFCSCFFHCRLLPPILETNLPLPFVLVDASSDERALVSVKNSYLYLLVCAWICGRRKSQVNYILLFFFFSISVLDRYFQIGYGMIPPSGASTKEVK